MTTREEDLKNLENLFNKSYISENEYDERKAEILGLPKPITNNIIINNTFLTTQYDNNYNNNVNEYEDEEDEESYSYEEEEEEEYSEEENVYNYNKNPVYFNSQVEYKSYDIPTINNEIPTIGDDIPVQEDIPIVEETPIQNEFSRYEKSTKPKPVFGGDEFIKVLGSKSNHRFRTFSKTTKAMLVDLSNFKKEKDNLGEPDYPTEATTNKWKQEQMDLAKRVVRGNPNGLTLKNIKYVGGIDISFAKNNKIDACVSIVVIEYPSLKVVYESYKMVKLTQPYIAGFLAFREVPHIVPLWESLIKLYPQYAPDVVVIDGNGINHMRGCGAACHLGVMIDRPTIGVAKKLLFSNNITDQVITDGMKTSNIVPMKNQNGEVLGHALKKEDGEIIYVSPGHKLDPETALSIVKNTLNRRPIPEPTFQADRVSREFLKFHYQRLD
eukprot:gene1180-1492_t